MTWPEIKQQGGKYVIVDVYVVSVTVPTSEITKPDWQYQNVTCHVQDLENFEVEYSFRTSQPEFELKDTGRMEFKIRWKYEIFTGTPV